MHDRFVGGGIDTTGEWVMGDPGALRVWREPWRGQGDRLISWNESPGKNTERIKALRLEVESAKIVDLPNSLREFRALMQLTVPARLCSTLEATKIPTTVTRLQLLGERTGQIPASALLPGVRHLIVEKVRFTPESFPGLAQLDIRLGSKQEMLERMPQCKDLRALAIGPINDPKAFRKLESLPLEFLKVSGGKLGELDGLERLQSLTDMWLDNLSKLSRLDRLPSCTALRELTISHCKNLHGIDALLRIRGLRRLRLFACGVVGADRIRKELNALRLDELTITGTR